MAEIRVTFSLFFVNTVQKYNIAVFNTGPVSGGFHVACCEARNKPAIQPVQFPHSLTRVTTLSGLAAGPDCLLAERKTGKVRLLLHTSKAQLPSLICGFFVCLLLFFCLTLATRLVCPAQTHIFSISQKADT